MLHNVVFSTVDAIKYQPPSLKKERKEINVEYAKELLPATFSKG